MKSFYEGTASRVSSASQAVMGTGSAGYDDHDRDEYIGTRARIAVYDAPACAPYLEEVGPDSPRAYIESLSGRVFELAHQRGGDIPYTVIREVAENFIHAGFAEPIVSILDGGRTIRFSDQGPGIGDKRRVLQPGFTTATSSMKRVIRGVGSGLPIVKDFLSVTGGRLEIEDNLERGSVVTISSSPSSKVPSFTPQAPHAEYKPLGHTPTAALSSPALTPSLALEGGAGTIRLSTRQKQVLALILESGSAGPSLVSRELGVGLSTAYRDLASLEELDLITADGGKRTLTEVGLSYLGGMSASPRI